MNKFQKLLSVFSAAVILATSTGLTAFADSSSSVVEENVGWQSVKSQYLKEDGTPLYPEVEPVLYDKDGNAVVADLVSKESLDTVSNDSLSSSYNLVTLGRIGPVRNQNPLGTCWAHGALASMESNMITKGYANKDVDYSEAHLAWFGLGLGPSDKNDPLYGDEKFSSATPKQVYDNGGNWLYSVPALARMSGAELESKVPYSVATSYQAPDESTRYDSYAFLTEANVMDPKANMIAVKNAVVNNGAVQVSYYHDDNYVVYKNGNCSYYTEVYNGTTNHAVAIVGWDDNYSVNNFDADCRPSKNGAWLIRNSWGDWFGKDGYFYISYEDSSISKAVSYTAEKSDTVSNLYQYDGVIKSYYEFSNGTSSNVFTAKASEKLDRVGFYTYDTDVPYTITIFTDVTSTPTSGTKVYTQTGNIPYVGYHTVKLNTPVQLTAGEKFAVAITFAGTHYHMLDVYSPSAGLSYYTTTTSLSSSTTWKDYYKTDLRSACIKAYTSKSAPAAVTGLKATVNNGQVSLIWDKYDGATSYRVYRADSENGAKTQLKTVGTNNCTDTTVTSGKTYYYYVAAYNSSTGSLSSYSNCAKVTVSIPLAAPTISSATTDGKSVSLKWNAVTSATSYRVFRADSANGQKTKIKTVGTLYCTDTTVKEGKTYYYFVAAYDSNTGRLSAYSAAKSVNVQAAIAAPTISSITTDGSTVSLKWNAVTSATSYRVFRADSANGQKTKIKTVGTLYCTDTTVKEGKTYYYFVAAYDSNTGRLSAYSAVKSIRVQLTLATPVITSATSNGTNVSIKWNAVTGATSYRIFRADSKTGTKKLLKTVGTLSCTDTTATAGKTYYYFVAAYNSTYGILSGYSEAKSVKV